MANITPDKLRRCADEALKAHGTAYIFEKRAASIRLKIMILSFLGIAGPASVGAIIGTYSLDDNTTKLVLFIAGTIAIIQLLFSIWSLVSGWNDKLAYYLESKSSNYNLSSQYQKLSQNTSISKQGFDSELNVLDREAELRAALDNSHDVADKEKRMGMRYGLRKFQRSCAGCNEIPTSMKSTQCGVCGNI